ncbi:hypothetical protein [Candidatus Enterococcus ferrettii]|uniref:50S ribosomal protein L29 n=1 Tax=Candidatus Enterococcus ferrettii TaxID=2815324 RepID=A0ABV0ET94_9ENTE|nr:hypothetical protein [Enterococcus sp. 665A]MBO1340233.1 hypothetical protein [Enterococcus sp. 665A]
MKDHLDNKRIQLKQLERELKTFEQTKYASLPMGLEHNRILKKYQKLKKEIEAFEEQ